MTLGTVGKEGLPQFARGEFEGFPVGAGEVSRRGSR